MAKKINIPTGVGIVAIVLGLLVLRYQLFIVPRKKLMKDRCVVYAGRKLTEFLRNESANPDISSIDHKEVFDRFYLPCLREHGIKE